MIQDAVWNTYIELGSTAYQQGYYEMADRMLEAALEEAQRLGHRDSPLASVFNKLAFIYYQQGNFKKAETVYKRALSLYEKMLGDDDGNVANIAFNLAELYFSQKKYGQAAPLYERAITIDEKLHGSQHRILEKRLMKLAWIYCLQQRHNDAHVLYKRARDIRESKDPCKVHFFDEKAFKEA